MNGKEHFRCPMPTRLFPAVPSLGHSSNNVGSVSLSCTAPSGCDLRVSREREGGYSRDAIPLGGLPLSTSAPRGGGGPKIGRFCRQTVLRRCGQGGKGVQNLENFADVLNGSPLTWNERAVHLCSLLHSGLAKMPYGDLTI